MMRKMKFFLVASSVVALNSCGQVPTHQSKDPISISDDEAYLLDSVDSTAEDSSDASTTTSSSVADDLEVDKIKERAARLLALADEDKSGDLSLEEFLAGPEKMRANFGRSDRPAPSTDQLEKMKTRLAEQFTKYAGEDALMSLEEVIIFLTESAPRISFHRDCGHGHRKIGHERGRGPHNGRGPEKMSESQSWEDLVKTYDKDGDGLLNKAEFAALTADRRARHDD